MHNENQLLDYGNELCKYKKIAVICSLCMFYILTFIETLLYLVTTLYVW